MAILSRNIALRNHVLLNSSMPTITKDELHHYADMTLVEIPVWAKNVDQNPVQQNVASDRGLHCLEIFNSWNTRYKWINSL